MPDTWILLSIVGAIHESPVTKNAPFANDETLIINQMRMADTNKKTKELLYENQTNNYIYAIDTNSQHNFWNVQTIQRP